MAIVQGILHLVGGNPFLVKAKKQYKPVSRLKPWPEHGSICDVKGGSAWVLEVKLNFQRKDNDGFTKF